MITLFLINFVFSISKSGYWCGPSDYLEKKFNKRIVDNCGEIFATELQDCCREHDFCFDTHLSEEHCNDLLFQCYRGLNASRCGDNFNKAIPLVETIISNLGVLYRETDCKNFDSSVYTKSDDCASSNNEIPNGGKCTLRCEDGFFYFNSERELSIECRNTFWVYILEDSSFDSDIDLLRLSPDFLENALHCGEIETEPKKMDGLRNVSCLMQSVRYGEVCYIPEEINFCGPNQTLMNDENPFDFKKTKFQCNRNGQWTFSDSNDLFEFENLKCILRKSLTNDKKDKIGGSVSTSKQVQKTSTKLEAVFSEPIKTVNDQSNPTIETSKKQSYPELQWMFSTVLVFL